jgi:O-methyltransferase
MRSFIRSILNVSGFGAEDIHFVRAKAEKIYHAYHEYTMIPKELYIDNLKLVNDFSGVKGCVVECGVWRGGMSAGMAELLPEREFYLFDSFEGLPKAREIDGENAIAWQKNTAGETYFDNCAAEMGFAEKAMRKSGAIHKLIKGWFNETLPQAIFSSEIAVLRLDADWYDSTKACLVNLYPKVAKGGVIILDDYYAWDGCSRALHDYLSENLSVSRIHSTAMGVAYVVKKD